MMNGNQLTKLTVIGLSGRMGSEILALAPAFKSKVTSGVVSHVSNSPVDPAAKHDLLVVEDINAIDPSGCDAVIDFSQPIATAAVVRWCVVNSKPLVSGVTAHSEQDKQALVDAGKKIGVFWAPNMSLGVAVVARMIGEFKSLEGFDFQIEEIHHALKKDRPSGTALFLQEKLTQAVKNVPPDPISIRGGGISGIHRIFAMGEEEMITLEHTAMSRRVFARGALTACRWLIGREAGFYGMSELLESIASAK